MACGDLFEQGDLVIARDHTFCEGYNLSNLIGTVVSHSSYVIVEFSVNDIRGNNHKKRFKLITWEVDHLLDIEDDDIIW